MLGVPSFELTDTSAAALSWASRQRGHHTVRVDPLACTRALHAHGFYYCDTLVEPYCQAAWFIEHPHPAVALHPSPALAELEAMASGAFVHGRFHRDPYVPRAQAEQRYRQWLGQLHGAGKVWGISMQQQVQGFVAVEGNQLVLHALAEGARGRGWAKYCWSPLCRLLFEQGQTELRSSISASNLAVLNLYASLGFKFRHPQDLYHRLSP